MAATTLTQTTAPAASMPDALRLTVVRDGDGRHRVTVSVGDLDVVTSQGSARVIVQQAAAVIEAHLSAWPASDGADVGAAGPVDTIPAPRSVTAAQRR